MIDPHDVLHVPMNPENNSAGAATIGEYLNLLLSTLWLEDEGFSAKRPFGDSSWKFEVYKAMIEAGFAIGTLDEDGYIEEFKYEAEVLADELILKAIKLAYDHG